MYEYATDQGNVYARYEQPTRRRVETVLGSLEGGCALAYSSGLAAIGAVFQYLLPQRVFWFGGYKGSKDALDAYIRVRGRENVAVFLDDRTEVEAGDLIHLESPSNPTCRCPDIMLWSDRANAVGAKVVVDSTFATPIG